MATGVKPRDEESQLTRSDLDTIQEAMKNKKFRDLLVDYCEEVRDPANQALYQKEMTQLEKERGYDVTFINPKGGYVIKTSVAGDRKAFINICSNENIGKPSCNVQEVDGKKGMNWQLPYSIIPPREDYDHKKERCVIYDVVFHPDTLRMAEVNKQFRELVNKTAYEGLQKTYKIHFDSNNFRFPKSQYKGMNIPAVIRKEDPDFKPPTEEEAEQLSQEILEKMYPQRNYSQDQNSEEPPRQNRRSKTTKPDFSHASDSGYTVPKYVIKQQKNIDFQDYTYHKDSKQYAAIPSHIGVEINLPLLSSTKDCILDVQEKALSLKSEKPAKYKLNIALPYPVNEECGTAKFDKNKRLLIVTLPVIKQNLNSDYTNLKVDSGVESEENSESHSDEDNRESKVVELSSTNTETSIINSEVALSVGTTSSFFDNTVGYVLPSYTHNVLDDVVAFTFHVKNTEYDSVQVSKVDSKVFIKFTSIGSGFVPVHYAAIIKFDECVKFENVTGEAWDNNVILQIELVGDAPQKFEIGLSEDSMVSEEFDMSQVTKISKPDIQTKQQELDVASPLIEVTNLGTETNIVVSTNHDDEDDVDLDEDDIESPLPKEKEIVWSDLGSSDIGAKSILRKPITMMRSFSESSAGDIASSMDYISSDCIPEEGSLKKTVRFNDVIARQFYRYNSSIEGQKKKNQRKKSKKRTQDRRRSESEAEDEIMSTAKSLKPRLKSALKQRRDSGLADTSDAETENRHPLDSEYYDNDSENGNENVKDTVKSVLNIVGAKEDHEEKAIWKSDEDEVFDKSKDKKSPQPITCENIKHNTDLYNPDKLNKGKYLEVSFKNDLIFDLDM